MGFLHAKNLFTLVSAPIQVWVRRRVGLASPSTMRRPDNWICVRCANARLASAPAWFEFGRQASRPRLLAIFIKLLTAIEPKPPCSCDSVLGQRPQIFHGSLVEAVLYGNSNRHAPDVHSCGCRVVSHGRAEEKKGHPSSLFSLRQDGRGPAREHQLERCQRQTSCISLAKPPGARRSAICR